MSLRAAREPDEDEYVSLEGKHSLMAGIGVERRGRVGYRRGIHSSGRGEMLQERPSTSRLITVGEVHGEHVFLPPSSRLLDGLPLNRTGEE